MKRLHIHLKTKDLDKSADFYTAMFGVAPTKRKDGYVQWRLDDPAANISLSLHTEKEGVDHVGVSFDTQDDLDTTAKRLSDRKVDLFEENETTCCYANSNKYWARDPQGAVWELFQTFSDADEFGAGPELPSSAPVAKTETCCAPV